MFLSHAYDHHIFHPVSWRHIFQTFLDCCNISFQLHKLTTNLRLAHISLVAVVSCSGSKPAGLRISPVYNGRSIGRMINRSKIEEKQDRNCVMSQVQACKLMMYCIAGAAPQLLDWRAILQSDDVLHSRGGSTAFRLGGKLGNPLYMNYGTHTTVHVDIN